MSRSDPLEGVAWFTNSSIRIRRAGVELHVDPWGVTEESTADFILLTHSHYDNFSEADIARLRGPRTVIIAPTNMRKQFPQIDHLMRPGDLLHVDGLDVLAVPAYNRDRKFHPPESGWLGYVFTIGDTTYYHAGHTDLIDEMSTIRADVALAPCDGRYMMGPEDLLGVGRSVHAEIVVPLHWGHVFEPLPADDASKPPHIRTLRPLRGE